MNLVIQRRFAARVAAVVVSTAAACGPPPSPEVGRSARGAQCGPTLDFESINAYDGTLDWVQQGEDAVAFINGSCTGVYIGGADDEAHLVLTAGHCVGLDDGALVVFNFEDDADGPQTVTFGTVLEVSDRPDYALIELPTDPGVVPVVLGNIPTGRMAIIQHPTGKPKVIATGRLSHRERDRLFYSDLDTLLGSSGAPVFNELGHVIGVHGGGNCDVSGTNWGWTAARIVEVSRVLTDYELEDC